MASTSARRSPYRDVTPTRCRRASHSCKSTSSWCVSWSLGSNHCRRFAKRHQPWRAHENLSFRRSCQQFQKSSLYYRPDKESGMKSSVFETPAERCRLQILPQLCVHSRHRAVGFQKLFLKSSRLVLDGSGWCWWSCWWSLVTGLATAPLITFEVKNSKKWAEKVSRSVGYSEGKAVG